jgi:transposase
MSRRMTHRRHDRLVDRSALAANMSETVTPWEFRVEGEQGSEADGCKTPGAVGALLRREGLYSSHLATWRAARERGDLVGVRKKRGPTPRVMDSRDKVIAEQARELARWKRRAERAEALVEVQKKVAALLGRPLDTEPS